MANFEAIKAAIDAVIKTNGRQEITGEVMNGVLNGMVDAVNEKKQDELVSGTNIKTINGNSILGEGNIEIQGGEGSLSAEIVDADKKIVQLKDQEENIYPITTPLAVIDENGKTIKEQLNELSAEVDKKVDADKVATINGQSLVGGGNITIEGGKGEKGDKGDQGNSGYTGAADELEVVNNLTQGGATAALSAEMGKELKAQINTWNGAIDATYLNLLESWDLTASTGYTNYIAAKPNTQYSFYRGATPQLIKPIAILEYDADKKQIKSTAANSITTTENTAYIRVNEYKSVTENTMVVEGDYVPTMYLSHEDSKEISTENQTFNDGIAEIVKRDVLPNYEVEGGKVKTRTLPINANDWINVLPYNIIDADAIIPNKSIDPTTGALLDYEYSNVTEFIAVLPGERYTKLSGITKVFFYDNTQFYTKEFASEAKNDFIIPQEVFYLRCVCKIDKVPILTSEDVSDTDSGNVVTLLQHKNEMHETMIEMLASAGSKVLVGEKYNLITALREASLSNGLFTYLSGIGKYISNKIEGIKGEYNFYTASDYVTSILGFSLLTYDEDDNLLSNKSFSGTKTFTLTEDCAYFRVYVNRRDDTCLVRGGAEDAVVYRDADTLKVTFRNDDYREQIMRDMLTNPKADKLLLNTLYPQLFGKKYAALGDSLTNGTGAKPYCQVAAEYFGMNLINYGIISSTLAEYDEAGGGYEPMSVRYADMDADAEVVTIMGGTNDIYSKIGTMSDRQENGQFTLYSGAHKLFKGIMEKYPNAKVGVILPPQFAKCLPTDTEGNGPDINLEKHQARLAAIKEVAEFYSLPVLDLCHHGGINGYGTVQRELFFQADKLHLTTAGQARLAEKVIAWMKNL